MTLLLPAHTPHERAEEQSLEFIDGEPVVPLETALHFLSQVKKIIPEWDILRLCVESKVESTTMDVFRIYSDFIQNCLGIEQGKPMSKDEYERYVAYLVNGYVLTNGIFSDFGSRCVPCPEELRKKYPEGSYARYFIELYLKVTRVRVKEALQIVHDLAFVPFDLGLDPALLYSFRKQFSEAMTMMGISYAPVALCGVEQSQIANIEYFGMHEKNAAQNGKSTLMPPFLRADLSTFVPSSASLK